MDNEKVQCFYNFLSEEAEKANRRFQNSWYRRGYVDVIRRIQEMYQIEFREELE